MERVKLRSWHIRKSSCMVHVLSPFIHHQVNVVLINQSFIGDLLCRQPISNMWNELVAMPIKFINIRICYRSKKSCS